MSENKFLEIISSHIKHGNCSDAVLLCDNSPAKAMPEGVRLFLKGTALLVSAFEKDFLPAPYNFFSKARINNIARANLLSAAEVYGLSEAQHNLEVLRCGLHYRNAGIKPSFIRVKGVSAYMKDDILGAIDLFNLAIRINPFDFAAYINLAVVYISIREYDKAEENLAFVLEANPCNIEAMYNIGRLYILTQRFDKARDVLARALNESPRDEEILYLLGEAELNLGNYSSARAMFSRAITDKNEFVSQSAAKRLLFMNNVIKDESDVAIEKANKICRRYIKEYRV